MQKSKKPKRKPQQDNNAVKGIDTIQEVAETAIIICRAILAVWRRGK
jgi:hypothetical protein